MSLSLVEDQISDPHIYAHSSTLRRSTKNETPLLYPLSFPACVHYICSGRGRKYLRQRKVSIHYKYLFSLARIRHKFAILQSSDILFCPQAVTSLKLRSKKTERLFLPEVATSAPKTHRSRATTTRPAANCPKERCLSSFTCVLPNCFCSFAVNKDQNNLHNHHPFSCRELAAALTRTPPAAKIKLTAVHMVGQRFSPFETLH